MPSSSPTRRRACPGSSRTTPHRTARIRAAERVAPYGRRIARRYALALLGRTNASGGRGRSRLEVLDPIVRNVRCVGLLFNLAQTAMGSTDAGADWQVVRAACRGNDARFPIETAGGVRTVLTPAYRRCAIDLEDERIHEGLRLTRALLGAMARKLAGRRVRPHVVFIPTEEAVFHPLLAAGAAVPAALEHQVANEPTLWCALREVLTRHGVRVVEVGGALRAAVGQRRPVHPIGRDGHPAPAGHLVIAHCVAATLGPRPTR